MEDATPGIRRFDDVRIATFFVGDAKTVYHVHTNLLFEASSVFQTFLTSQFEEGAIYTMTLPEHDTEPFDNFVKWLYTPFGFKIPLSNTPLEEADYIGPFMRMYVFTEKYKVTGVKNALIDGFFAWGKGKFRNRIPACAVITYIFESTHPGCGIRRLIADWMICHAAPLWMQKSRIHRWIQRTPGLAAELKRSIFRFLLADPRTPFVDELDAAAKYYWDEIPLEADESALSVPLVSIPFGLLA